MSTQDANANIQRFNEMAASWDDDPGHQQMARAIGGAMLDALTPDGTQQALEFGCGTGLVTLMLAPHYAHFTALDSSTAMLDALRRKCEQAGFKHVHPLQGSVPDDLPAAQFDLIASSMALHHVKDTSALLHALYARLKPGGRLAIADLDHEDGSFHNNPQGVMHHGFEHGALTALLKEGGFTDVRFVTAHTIERGEAPVRRYPVFLMTATRPLATRKP